MLQATVEGQLVEVVRPDARIGQGSVDLLCALERARLSGAGVCVLSPEAGPAELADWIDHADVALVRPSAMARARLARRWRWAETRGRAKSRWHLAVSSGLQELYRELRRHAGNARFSPALRRRLREAGHRAYDRSVDVRAPQQPYPRRLLRDRSTVQWAPALVDGARTRLAAAGVAPGTPVAAFEVTMRPVAARAAARCLSEAGYAVVRVGDRSRDVPALPQVVYPDAVYPDAVDPDAVYPDAVSPEPADLHVMALASLAVVGSMDLQQLTYLTNTPSLTVDATDVFTRYPIRADGLVLLATAVDLDTGRDVALDEWLSEAYFRSRRHHGYRGASPEDLVAAIGELCAGVAHGWTHTGSETGAQRRFRERVVQAGTALAATVPLVAKWGPDAGFIGDGRLAQVQAERAA
jgi:hypothetical protein